jgi:hypothetical protein
MKFPLAPVRGEYTTAQEFAEELLKIRALDVVGEVILEHMLN